MVEPKEQTENTSGGGSQRFFILPDPLKDRKVKTLETPAQKPIEQSVLFPPSGKNNIIFNENFNSL